ncbi:hypothetical protein BCR33DRAFT_712546 [Rhizoclosmatium globosum]|uniref:AB hydrolase-1 domain-containing protein n=1 Tax=Rhizoclosmatium globosum TaxID=329046 RepID=A0A1Y2CWU1_9FUNG|nr:hypothetical protein BCR33DRAFT_712546 [Rhizoclosmatium globosum]|eukprot:ORY51502.1 hypothetical protein BCR33DRAFT_712546 [Rhizoclosmatium globosum]
MPVPNTLAMLIAVRAAALTLDAIPVLAIAFTLQQTYQLLVGDVVATQYDSTTTLGTIKSILPYYFSIETAFLVYFYLQSKRLQAPVPPAPMSVGERGKIFYKVLDSTGTKFEEFFSGWFYWNSTKRQLTPSELHVIRRDNIRDWLAWSFFSVSSYAELESDPERVSELNGFIADMEMMKGTRFHPGKNLDISPVILNYNPIAAKPKPLILYAFIWSLEAFGLLLMTLLGFKRVTPIDRPYHHDSEATLNYWVYMPKSYSDKSTQSRQDDKLPIVFLHGIGCGLFPYVHFIYSIMSHMRFSRPVFVIEFPHVSMKLHDHAHVIGHSLGTTIACWLVKYSKYAASCVLLDPVTFMYLLPSLAFSFVHRKPGYNTDVTKADEYLLYWLCSRELYTANAITRHFRWHHSLIWPENLPKNHHVVVGKRDFLFDGTSVADYLAEHDVDYKLYDTAHAEFMLRPRITTEIVAKIAQVCNSADLEFALSNVAAKSVRGNVRKSVRRRRA